MGGLLKAQNGDKTHLGTPSLREVRAEGWSELSPRCVGAAARRAGLSPLFCDAPISRRPVCFLMHTLPPFGPAELGGFFLEFLRTDSEFGASRPLRERIRGHRGSISLRSFFSRRRGSAKSRTKRVRTSPSPDVPADPDDTGAEDQEEEQELAEDE